LNTDGLVAQHFFVPRDLATGVFRLLGQSPESLDLDFKNLMITGEVIAGISTLD
jgi:hypothetical protein